MGQSMEMGTIHAGDFLVCWFQTFLALPSLAELVVYELVNS
jgi:hypothetical protein